MIDAPISGTGPQAQAKDITIFASGDRGHFERAREVLSHLARSVRYVGPFGAGSKLKYIANLLVAIHVAAAAEAIVLGERAGLDPAMLVEVLADSAATSRMLEVRGPSMAASAYATPMMKLNVFQKDLDIIESFATRIEMSGPLVQHCRSPVHSGRRTRHGRARHSRGNLYSSATGASACMNSSVPRKIAIIAAGLLTAAAACAQAPSAKTGDVRSSLQERSHPQRHSGGRIHGHHGILLGVPGRNVHRLPQRRKWRQLGEVRRRQPAQEHSASHDRHDERHQQDLLRRKARDHVLLLPSRRGTSRRHSQPGGSVRSAADERAGSNCASRPAKPLPPDQILDKYIQAIGGSDRLAKVTSFAAKGTYQGYQDEKYPVDVFAQAPGRLTTIVHTAAGDSATTFDGRTGWIAGPATERPVALLELTGTDLTGARLDAALRVSRAPATGSRAMAHRLLHRPSMGTMFK